MANDSKKMFKNKTKQSSFTFLNKFIIFGCGNSLPFRNQRLNYENDFSAVII